MSPTMTEGGWLDLSRVWAAPSAQTMESQADSSFRSSGPGSSPLSTTATFTRVDRGQDLYQRLGRGKSLKADGPMPQGQEGASVGRRSASRRVEPGPDDGVGLRHRLAAPAGLVHRPRRAAAGPGLLRAYRPAVGPRPGVRWAGRVR